MDRLRLSISESTTLKLSFEEDLAAYKGAGADGIGIWESKLPAGEDARSLDLFAASGLEATICGPNVPSIYPDGFFAKPETPRERTEALCAAIRRFAPFKPVVILCTTGDPAGRDVASMRRGTVEGLRAAADLAGELGIQIAIEGYRKTSGSLVSTIPGMVELADEVKRPNVGIIADTWHVWDDPGVLEDLKKHARRIFGVQVADWRVPTRGWADRVLPGDGVIDWPSLLRAVEAGGYNGWYDVEIFSDDGTFGDAYPDSLWARDPYDLAREAIAGFRRIWSESRPTS